MTTIAQFSAKAFVKSLALVAPPCLLMAALIYIAAPGDIASQDYSIALALSSVTIIPATETIPLIFTTHLAGQAIKNKWLAAIAGATPMIALHFVNGWRSAACTAWLFIWSAKCFEQLSTQGNSTGQKFIFLWALHAIWNLTIISIDWMIK